MAASYRASRSRAMDGGLLLSVESSIESSRESSSPSMNSSDDDDDVDPSRSSFMSSSPPVSVPLRADAGALASRLARSRAAAFTTTGTPSESTRLIRRSHSSRLLSASNSLAFLPSIEALSLVTRFSSLSFALPSGISSARSIAASAKSAMRSKRSSAARLGIELNASVAFFTAHIPSTAVESRPTLKMLFWSPDMGVTGGGEFSEDVGPAGADTYAARGGGWDCNP